MSNSYEPHVLSSTTVLCTTTITYNVITVTERYYMSYFIEKQVLHWFVARLWKCISEFHSRKYTVKKQPTTVLVVLQNFFHPPLFMTDTQ